MKKFHASLSVNFRHNSGFSLVELMVALVIGLIIVLGAGQIFLMGFQSFRQIELLGNKQSALSFATEMLIRDVRRARYDDCDVTDPDCHRVKWDDDAGELTLYVDNRGDISTGCGLGDEVERIYRLSSAAVSDREGWSLDMGQNCTGPVTSGDFEPLVTSFAENGFDVIENAADQDAGIWVFEFSLISGQGVNDSFTFNAVNRTTVVAD